MKNTLELIDWFRARWEFEIDVKVLKNALSGIDHIELTLAGKACSV